MLCNEVRANIKVTGKNIQRLQQELKNKKQVFSQNFNVVSRNVESS